MIELQVKARPIADSLLHERSVVDYPRQALREFAMNAVLHRSYESTGPVRMGSPVGKYTFGPATGGPQGQINFGAKPVDQATSGAPGTGNPPAALALTATAKKQGKKAPAVKAPTKKIAATK